MFGKPLLGVVVLFLQVLQGQTSQLQPELAAAQTLIDHGDLPAASKALRAYLQSHKDSADGYFLLGYVLFQQRAFDGAVPAFQECLKLDPKNVKAADSLGLALEALGKTEEALSPLLQAVRLAPGDWRRHRELGKAYSLLNRLDEAQAELEKAESLAPDDASVRSLLAEVNRRRGFAHSSPETSLAEARALVGQGKLYDAERMIRGFLQTQKSSADGHFLLGYVLFKKQDAKSSLAEYTEGARYRNPGAADLEVVASDYVLLKDYLDADKWYSKAVEFNPSDSLGWYYLGRTKYNENRFQEAIGAFQQCLKLDPKNVKAEDNLGLTYEGLNQTEDALAAYRTAIEWQTDAPQKNSGPYLDLGSLLVESGQASEGLPYLLEAAKLSPDDYGVHRQLGKAYSRLDQLDKARVELEKAVALAPKNAPVHFMLAQVYRKQGLAEKAKAENDLYRSLTGTSSAPE